MSLKDFIRKSVLNVPGKARKTLESRGVSFTEDSFLECVRSGKVEDVGLFLEAGMSPDVRGTDGISAVQAAVEANQPGVLSALADRGADLGAKDSDGNSLLIRAILEHHEEIGITLIARGAPVDARNNAGFSAAMLCARENQTGIAEALLHAGADVLVKNHASGETALNMAAQRGFLKMVELMLRNAITADDRNDPDKNGASPLWWAARGGHTEVVRVLCSKKADVNQANRQGQTPLMMAAASGNEDSVKELLAGGARKELLDSEQKSALDYAREAGHSALLDLLRP